MRTLKNASGAPMFTVEERLSKSQISGFFSAYARERKQKMAKLLAGSTS